MVGQMNERADGYYKNDLRNIEKEIKNSGEIICAVQWICNVSIDSNRKLIFDRNSEFEPMESFEKDCAWCECAKLKILCVNNF